MSTAAQYRNGIQTYSETTSFETVGGFWPVNFHDDFLGAGAGVIPAAGSAVSGCSWVKKIVGAAPPTVGAVADAAGGQVACALTATSEKEDAALYFGDALSFDVTQGLVFECVVALATLPSAGGVQCVWGVSSAWIDGPNNAAAYLEFGVTANGNVLLRSQDGTTQNSIACGVTIAAGVPHVYRIDANDLADIRYFIDGNQVNVDGAIGFAATGAAAVLQPYLSAYKPGGVGVATLTVDSVRVGTTRGAS